MLRRINWYLQAWPQLAGLYEQTLKQSADARQLRENVIEYDNVYGMAFYDQSVVEAFPMRRLSAISNCARAASG